MKRPASGDGDEGDDAETEGGGKDETARDAADEEAEPRRKTLKPPEFWGPRTRPPECLPLELRPVLKKYEPAAGRVCQREGPRAAQVRDQAAQDVSGPIAVIVQAAQWWRRPGRPLQQAFANKGQRSTGSIAEKTPPNMRARTRERQ